jgi:riboflavin kinase/FMN adenylyltransferase
MSKKRVMQLVRGLHNLRPEHRGCVATIGNFDGVHRGHQAILARLRERGQALGVPTCVVIFEPQPREYFAPTPRRRAWPACATSRAAGAEGIDRVLCLAFNQRLSKLSADEFVKAILVDGLGVRISKSATTSASAATAPATSISWSRPASVRLYRRSRQHRDPGRPAGQQHRSAQGPGEGDFAGRAPAGPPVPHPGACCTARSWPASSARTANIQLKRRRVPLSGVYLASIEIDGKPGRVSAISACAHRCR